MMVLRPTETHDITLKNLTYLRPNSEIPRVPIRLRDLAKNNAFEFSVRKMQLTRFSNQARNEVAAAGG